MTPRTVQTVEELFDLPEGAVFISATGRVGEVEEPRNEDLEPWQLESTGERLLARRNWTGTDIYDLQTYPQIPDSYFPARVLYVPGEPDPVAAQLRSALEQAEQTARRYFSETAGRPNVPTAVTKARYARLEGIVAGLKQALALVNYPTFITIELDTLRDTPLDS